MIDPFSWAAVAATALGSGISAVGSIESGKQQDEVFKYQAAQERAQAMMAEREAQAAAQQARESNQGALAAMRARQGASGVVDRGTAIENLSSFARNLEADALDIERQGQIAKNDLTARSEISRIQGRNARRAGYFGGATSLISGTREISMAVGTGMRNRAMDDWLKKQGVGTKAKEGA